MLTFSDVISLFIDIFLLLNVEWSQNGPNPHNEALLLKFKECDCLIKGLVDLHCELDLQFIGQFIHKVNKVSRTFAVVILYRANQTFVEAWPDLVLTLDVV